MLSYKNLKIYLLIVLFSLLSCDGTLGGFNTIRFPVSKKNLEIAIDSLYFKHPKYKIPDKFQDYNSWSERGYDFLDSRLFYFSEFPEEMYYISFIGLDQTFKDTTHIDIAIRSVFIESKERWLEEKDFTEDEKIRINSRFKNEILSKLEEYTNSKAKDLGY